MAAFRALADVSNYFEDYVKKSSVDLVAVRAGDTFNDDIARKLKDLNLYSSKLRLLRAKPISFTSVVTEQPKTEQTTILQYGETVTQKIIENQIVKSLTQSYAVRKLLTTSDSELQPELIQHRDKLLSQLEIYKLKETQYRLMDTQLREKQSHLDTVREKWDTLLGELKDLRQQVDSHDEEETVQPLNRKLQSLVRRMEMFRFLISKFVRCRTSSYDWLADPDNLLSILKVTRQQNTIAMFTGRE